MGLRAAAWKVATRSRGRWGTSGIDALGHSGPGASVDANTVAAILSDVEERGGLIAGVGAPPMAVGVERSRRRRIKHVIDADMAALLLVLLAPLLALIAAAVWLSSRGPVLFKQQRVGEGGRGFVMLKFRSMRQPTALVRFEPRPGLAPGGVEGEDRRTAVGRVIRALSLDELPQLLNVLRGEMSLVGPRPERPHFVDRFARELPGYSQRHRVRPGITGWAQVHGCRGATSIRRRLDLDIEYIRRWSLWLDLKILALTGVVMLGMGPADDRRRAAGGEALVVGRRQPNPVQRYWDADGAGQASAQAYGSGNSLDS